MRPDLLARIDATGKPYKLYTDVIEDGALKQFAECMEQPSVTRGALMPDTHKGYVAPIGSVLLTKNTIYSSFVGYDIGCGMSSITIDNIKTADITPAQLTTIRNQILRDIPIGFNRHSQPQIHTLNKLQMTDFARTVLKDVGAYQLGTLGGGKDYCFQAQR